MADPEDDGQNGIDTPGEARFVYLLAALLVLLVLYPFEDETLFAHLSFAVVNSAILVAAVFSASHSRQTLFIAVAMAAPALVMQWFYTVYRDPVIGDIMYLAQTFFYGFTIFQVLVQVLRPGAVTYDKICGAIAAYILAAVAWATLYGMVDSLVPGSFVIYGQSDKINHMNIQDFLFFSFTTLTSTGYGNIFPVGRHAQSLTILEQLAGVFYVAILIARLAGLYQPRASRRTNRRGS